VVRILIEMVDTRGVERGRSPLDAVHGVTKAKQIFGEIGAVLTGDAGYQRNAPCGVVSGHISQIDAGGSWLGARPQETPWTSFSGGNGLYFRLITMAIPNIPVVASEALVTEGGDVRDDKIFRASIATRDQKGLEPALKVESPTTGLGEFIPLYRPFLGGREKEYVNQCIDSSWISSRGVFVERFERAFGNFIGAPHATSVCNGTVALHLALESLGLGPQDEVIVPTLTYIASVNTIIQTGATPIFAESLDATWQIDPEDVRRKITPRTKALMVVHLYGHPCEMDELVSICNEFNLYLIEDCAEAFGTYYKGRHVGTFGDFATFSFFGNKTITTGEGGMVVAGNKDLLARAYHLKTQAVSPDREYWHDAVGYNYRMTNICGAIGLAQLENAKAVLEKKRQIAIWYKQGLQGLPLKKLDETHGTKHSFWMCSIVVDDPGARQALRDWLKAANVETRPVFHPCHTLPHCRTGESFPVAESLSARGINLPSFPQLSQENTTAICGLIARFFGP
jgi:perosamine synthetase